MRACRVLLNSRANPLHQSTKPVGAGAQAPGGGAPGAVDVSPAPPKPLSGSDQLAMMELHQGGSGERVVLEGYYDDGFAVFGQRCAGPIAVLPDLATEWRGVATVADITYDSLMLFVLAKPKVDILIIGTGKRTEVLAPALRAQMRAHGIVVECMASNKALATFNILSEEARHVGAALLTMTQSGFEDDKAGAVVKQKT